MPAGVPTYLTSPKFAFPRSYVPGVYFRHDLSTWSFADNILSLTVSGAPDALVKYTFHENFIPWQSNKWTLDYILTAATYEYPPNPTVYQLPYYIGWIIPPDTWRGHILLDCIYGANFSIQEFPPQEPGYWLPVQYS